MSAGIHVLYSLFGGKDNRKARNDVNVGVNLTAAHALLDVALVVAEDRLLQLRMDQLLFAQCWLATLDPTLARFPLTEMHLCVCVCACFPSDVLVLPNGFVV